MLRNGSSPRMWGTLPELLPHFPVVRFIPTHVGNTHSPFHNVAMHRFIPTHVGNTESFALFSVIISVHPHACGEHYSAASCPFVGSGSSPRMWGTPCLTPRHVRNHRFIPTHVGNTRPRTREGVRPAVHPHACGEHIPLCMFGSFGGGSSPRMWGTLA